MAIFLVIVLRGRPPSSHIRPSLCSSIDQLLELQDQRIGAVAEAAVIFSRTSRDSPLLSSRPGVELLQLLQDHAT